MLLSSKKYPEERLSLCQSLASHLYSNTDWVCQITDFSFLCFHRYPVSVVENTDILSNFLTLAVRKTEVQERGSMLDSKSE